MSDQNRGDLARLNEHRKWQRESRLASFRDYTFGTFLDDEDGQQRIERELRL